MSFEEAMRCNSATLYLRRTKEALVTFPHPNTGDVDKIAIQEAIKYEESRGWVVESVEDQDHGFDLISRKLHPKDPETYIEVRFIEVEGRAGVGEVALSSNEYKTADRLKKDYWLYGVYNCASEPEVRTINDPARLGWKPRVKIEHYHIGVKDLLSHTDRD